MTETTRVFSYNLKFESVLQYGRYMFSSTYDILYVVRILYSLLLPKNMVQN
jgi:hypothetical protein